MSRCQHRDGRHLLFEGGDGRPVGGAGVALGGGAGVQGDRGGTLGLGDPAGVEVGVVVVVDPDPELHGDRDVGAGAGPHGGRDDPAEQSALVGQRGAAAAAGDLGHRAAEVGVDVVGQARGGDHPGRVVGGVRVDGVELQRPRGLVGSVVLVQGHRVAFDQRRAVTISQT